MEDAGEEHLVEDLRQDPRRDHREAQDQGGEEEHHCFKESRRLRLEEQEELVAAIDQGFTIVYYKVPALLLFSIAISFNFSQNIVFFFRKMRKEKKTRVEKMFREILRRITIKNKYARMHR